MPDVQFWLKQSVDAPHALPFLQLGLQLGRMHLPDAQF